MVSLYFLNSEEENIFKSNCSGNETQLRTSLSEIGGEVPFLVRAFSIIAFLTILLTMMMPFSAFADDTDRQHTTSPVIECGHSRKRPDRLQ